MPKVVLPRSAPALVALVWLVVVAPRARGDDPFVLTAQTTSGPPASVTASGSSLPDLVDDLVRTQNQFGAFEGQAFRAGLDYGSIKQAIRFEQNAAGTSATVSIPSTGFSKTFTGSSDRDVRNQIRDFLLKQGSGEYARFLRTVNERSLIGVTDGNPLAATALLADSSFFKFGLQRSPYEVGGMVVESRGGGLRLDLGGGVADTDDGDGYFLSAALSSLVRFNRHVGLALSSPFTYRRVEGAEVFNGGFEAGLPVVIASPITGRGAVWQVTPTFLGGAAGSLDLAAGGTFLGGGVTNSIAVPLGESAEITVGNGIYFFEGYGIHFGEYEFDTDLSQQVLKNGVKLTQALGRGGFVDASITHTAFLQEAAVGTYLTPGVGVGLRFGPTSGVRFAYRGNYGDGFTSHGGAVTLFFNY
jgi:hypothetical protein